MYAPPEPTPYPPVVPQQQQRAVTVVHAGSQPEVLHNVQSFSGHIVLACVIFCCCNLVFGLGALLLAC